MDWTARHNRDAFKEVWLLFEGEHGHFQMRDGVQPIPVEQYRGTGSTWKY
jgi:hypothetical protein